MPEFDRSTPVYVALHCRRGKVDVTAEDRVSVLVDVVPLDGSDGARQAAENTVVALEGNTLVVRTSDASDRLWHRAPRLGITVRVPSDSSLAATTASADVRATGRFAQIEASVASGDVSVQEVTGDAHLKAGSGDLTVGRVGGSLRISSASGDLEVGDVRGDVSVETASGDVFLRSAGGSVRMDTASGDIEIGVIRQGRTGIRSASGDVKVGVAAGTGVWLDVNTASGSTRNELTMGADAPGATAASTGAKLELRIRTASGDIEIRRVTGAFPAAA